MKLIPDIDRHYRKRNRHYTLNTHDCKTFLKVKILENQVCNMYIKDARYLCNQVGFILGIQLILETYSVELTSFTCFLKNHMIL